MAWLEPEGGVVADVEKREIEKSVGSGASGGGVGAGVEVGGGVGAVDGSSGVGGGGAG